MVDGSFLGTEFSSGGLILISVLLAMFFSQGYKIVVNVTSGGKFKWSDLIVTGGMPSGHSAIVSSLVLGIYFHQGLSALFVLALVLALIVSRDAFGVRNSVGIEGEYLKKLLKKHKIKSNLKIAKGHTMKEVFVGSILGLVIASAVYLL